MSERNERDALGKAIAEAAYRAGIYNGEVSLAMPHLLMLLDDMATAVREGGAQIRREERERAAEIAEALWLPDKSGTVVAAAIRQSGVSRCSSRCNHDGGRRSCGWMHDGTCVDDLESAKRCYREVQQGDVWWHCALPKGHEGDCEKPR